MAELNVNDITTNTIDPTDKVYGFSADESKAPTVETLLGAAPGIMAVGTCATAAATAAKAVTSANWTAKPGQSILIEFTNANTANNVTLSINQGNAIPVYYLNCATEQISGNAIPAGAVIFTLNAGGNKFYAHLTKTLSAVDSTSKLPINSNATSLYKKTYYATATASGVQFCTIDLGPSSDLRAFFEIEDRHGNYFQLLIHYQQTIMQTFCTKNSVYNSLEIITGLRIYRENNRTYLVIRGNSWFNFIITDFKDTIYAISNGTSDSTDWDKGSDININNFITEQTIQKRAMDNVTSYSLSYPMNTGNLKFIKGFFLGNANMIIPFEITIGKYGSQNPNLNILSKSSFLSSITYNSTNQTIDFVVSGNNFYGLNYIEGDIDKWLKVF